MSNTTIFEKYHLTDELTLKNRVVLSPLDMQMSRSNGQITQRDVAFHRARSRDVGLDIIGSAYIATEGNTAPHSISVADNQSIIGLSKLAKTIHHNGTKAILQLVHAGRATMPSVEGQQVVAPSAIASPFGGFPTPVALTDRQITKILNQFIEAAERAERAGFDGVEIHGANSFLVQQFVSPAANLRTDKFGGSLVKRLRFPVELVNRLQSFIRSLSHPFALGYRLSPEELFDGGMTLTDTMALAMVLDHMHIDYLSLSLRQFSQPSGLQKDASESVVSLFKRALTCPVMVSGGVTTVDKLVDASDTADLVAVGTALMQKPNWLRNVRIDLNETNA